jgi:hypothetical protein
MGSFASAGLRSAAGHTIWTPPGPLNGDIIAPTPENFEIITVDQVGSLYVSMIQYPGCINFEGKKVLVTEWDPYRRRAIDPHFLPKNGLLARFEPTPRGYEWAIKFARIAAKDYP